MPAKVIVQLVVRQGCHLCEQAQEALDRVLLRAVSELGIDLTPVELIDVDSDLKLLAKFGEEVPVLLINGLQRGFFRIDEERLFEFLKSLSE